jgi:hypothetical protein
MIVEKMARLDRIVDLAQAARMHATGGTEDYAITCLADLVVEAKDLVDSLDEELDETLKHTNGQDANRQ